MPFISFISPIFCLFFINTLLVKITNRKFGDCFPLTLIGLPLITLLSHYVFHNLTYGVYLIYALYLTSVIFFIKNTKNKEFRDKIFTVGTFMYFFIYLFIYIATRGVYFFAWDEFAHWGPMINQLVDNNKMYTNMFHSSYPPLVQLFEYILVKLGIIFEENNLKFAVQFFNMAIICIPISERYAEEDKKRFSFLKSLLTFFIVFLLAIGIDSYNSFRTIYLDVTVATFFAYVLYLIIYEEEKYILAIATFAFIMVKDISVLFMAFVLFYVFVDSIFSIVSAKERKEILKKKAIDFLYLLIPMIVSYLLWHIYKVNAGVLNDQFSLDKFSVSSFFDIFTGKLSGEQLVTYEGFMKGIFDINLSRSSIPFTYFSSYVVLEVILAIYTFASKVKNKVLIFIKQTIFITVTYFIYMLFMLNMYINILDGTHSTDLASFARYVSTLVLGIYIVTFIYIYKHLQYRWSLLIVYLVMSVVLGSSFLSYALNPKVNHSLLYDPLQNERKAYLELNDTITSSDRCLVIINKEYYTDVVKDYYNRVGYGITLYDVKNLDYDENIKYFLDGIHEFNYLYIVDTLDQTIVPFKNLIGTYLDRHPEYNMNFDYIPANEAVKIK